MSPLPTGLPALGMAGRLFLTNKRINLNMKYIIILLIAVSIFSCKKDDEEEKHDPVAQAILDDAELVEFLQTHYLNSDNEIELITDGETPLYNEVETDDIYFNNIDYKMYRYMGNEGVGIKPSSSDSIQCLYKGYLLNRAKFDQNLTYTTSRSWFHLPNLILGWRYGFPHYKAGEKISYPDESFGYENAGQGIIFIPSGLAYGPSGSYTIPPNSPIYFTIELGAVVAADADNDWVVNSDEDLDQDQIVTNDDTDNDGVPNYLDVDDDGDGTLTKEEDANGDGDPRNDDTDGDGVPDYLDKDTK